LSQVGDNGVKAPSITLRPVREEDRELLYQVYRSTRLEELAMVADWSEEQKESFVRQQFDAQDAWYREHYIGASFDVILIDGVPGGRLYLHDRPDEIRLVDITLLPEFRGGGTGTSLLRDILARADAAGKAVRIHVEKYNPALRLYERLGFVPIADRGVYHLMERAPE